MKRTTLYLDDGVIEFLHHQNIPISEKVREFLLKFSLKIGYEEGIEDIIKGHKEDITILRDIKKKAFQVKTDQLLFLRSFQRYLIAGQEVEAKTHFAIREWLTSHENQKNYGRFIGRPASLTSEKVDELILAAMKVKL